MYIVYRCRRQTSSQPADNVSPKQQQQQKPPQLGLMNSSCDDDGCVHDQYNEIDERHDEIGLQDQHHEIADLDNESINQSILACYSALI